MNEHGNSEESAKKNTVPDYRVIEEKVFWHRSRRVEFTPKPRSDAVHDGTTPACFHTGRAGHSGGGGRGLKQESAAA